MMDELKRFIRKRKHLCRVCKICYRPISKMLELPSGIAASKLAITRVNKISDNSDGMRIFYFGVPNHANLGDQAQWFCIHRWLKQYLPQMQIFEFTDKMVRDNRYGLISLLRKKIKPADIIIFQSGYCTTDQNMPAEIMHRTIINNFPENKIVIFPQTVNYFTEKQKQISAEIYNAHKKMIFLARDKVSFALAQDIFSQLKRIELYPDIVTSLIGKYNFNNKRDKVLFCMRNDGEQYYERSNIQKLRENISSFTDSEITDTTLKMSGSKMQENIQNILEQTFEYYSRYKAIITDRYHGTIFSLIARTPVVVLDSTDHKLKSGVDWFKDVYPQYVYFAANLDEAYTHIKTILVNQSEHESLDDHFDKEYYGKLLEIIQNDGE